MAMAMAMLAISTGRESEKYVLLNLPVLFNVTGWMLLPDT